ncbi:polycomb group protein ASXL1 isoform X2 [Echeneis naucrates]|uniref:polycomb group protein ASXL1 isoform X2 n=1 Tax=Echeneis naucrates TaxID=173247 RepID=UPI001113F27B|nr:putative Polycomb group protein ASXL1 isoform X2 [Echeneis naucrates]
MKDKQKRKKERTWAEAARMVLENFSDAPMTPKQILHVIQTKGLKEMSGTAPLACLVTMLHSQVRGDRVKNSIFFKLPGRMSLFTLKKNALQWTKTTSESETPTDAAGSSAHSASSSIPAASSAVAPDCPTEITEQESCDSTETTAAASGDNDASVDESSSSASCSTELHAPSSQPQTRLSRAAGQQGRTDTQQTQHPQHAQTRLSRSRQSGRQRKKAVMMPRVVLTPLKVNGEHVPSGPMKRSRGGVDVDFETPGSILVNTNIRALINVRTFSAFPAHSQQQLLQLLPEVDRQIGPDGMARLSSSALNNEFFTHASQSWKERLAEGEFTHEMQVRFRQEMEKEKKVEAWKEKFFEEYHGQKSGLTREESLKLTMNEASEVGASVLDSDVAVVASGAPKRRSVGRRRRDGRMRRRTRADLRRRARRNLCKTPASALQPAEAAEASAAVDISAVAVGSPVSDSTVVQNEVVLPAECGVELPAESGSMEPKPSPNPESVTLPAITPTPTPSPSPSPASISANEEPEVTSRLLPKEAAPVLTSTSSPSSSSSSVSSASSPASSPSSPSDRQGGFTAGLDSSSSSSASSSAAVAADPLDDAASVVTSITGGTVTSSRESSPSVSPASTPAPSTQLKEQKRRPDETQAFSSFPEKRPRLDDRQSFRTTIDSVRSEKPQPTTEEPKVPPIRIQLSRIKPPWVKGHPTYQICPRIVPPGEGSRRTGTGGARTLADIKARAQQARAQREAAAAVAASGDGTRQVGVRLRPAAGISDSTSGRRAREHPGPIEPGGGGGRGGRSGSRGDGGVEEHGSSSGANSSGTQLLLLNVDHTAQPSPSLSTTSTSMSLEPSQTPSPPREEAAGGQESVEETEATSDYNQSPSHGFTDKVVDLPPPEPDTVGVSVAIQSATQNHVPESVVAHSEREDQQGEKPPLAPTSIPDSLPRFGAQGVDVIQTLASSKEQGKDIGQGVIQHGSHHVDPQEPLFHSRQQTDAFSAHHADSSVGEKEDEAATHSDSTETASDCENESQDDEQQQPDKDWDPSLNTQRNSQLVICSPSLQNQQPVIQSHVSSRQGQTVIQPCFPNNLSQPQQSHSHSLDHQSLTTVQTIGPKETNIVVTMELVDDGRASRQSSGEEECRGGLKPSAVASKRLASSARPVSSVEANNPLVTQLLQGSLPLEKVLPSHTVNRLEINRLPGPQPRPQLARTLGPRQRPEALVPSSSPELNAVSQIHIKSLTGRPVSCLMEAPAVSQYQSQQAPGAVPVITSLPPSSSSTSALSSRSKSDPSSQNTLESVVIKESRGTQPSPGATPDRPHPAHRTMPNGPSPPHADTCPTEVLPTIKINWCPPQSQLPHSHQQQLSPAPTIKNEAAARPSCQALAKFSPTVPVSVTKKEPLSSVDSYLSGGAMEGLLNMEMTLARMAKKEHSKAPYSSCSPSTSSSPSPSSSVSSLPFQLYGKLPKQVGGVGSVSYTANVSVMDNGGFSRSMADGVLQLHPRLASSQTTLSIQAFTDSTAEEVALKCSCRLKAMIMCQGCGAFCHDDCIGPSKLCVSCLVVR